MAHVFGFAEARKTWLDVFLDDLSERRYPYTMNTGQVGWIQPNVREIKLLDVSVPEECIPQLMSDLSPFASPNMSLASGSKAKAMQLAKGLRIAGGFKSLFPEEDVPILVKDIPSILPSTKKVFDFIDGTPSQYPYIRDLIFKLEEIPSNIPYLSWLINKIEKVPMLGKRLITSRKKTWRIKVREKISQLEELAKAEKEKWMEKDVTEIPHFGKDLDKAFKFLRKVETKELFEPSDAVRHSWVNYIPIGWRDDPHDPMGDDAKFFGLPKGGELL